MNRRHGWRARLRGRWFTAVAMACISAVTLVVYEPSHASSFHLDDLFTFASPSFARQTPLELLRAYPTRGLTYLTFLLNARLGGQDPRGYHAVNIALHLVATALVMALTRVLWRPMRRRYGSATAGLSWRWMMCATGLLFAVHPLQSQAVIYLSQRAALMATVCYLAALVYAGRLLLPGRSRVRNACGAALWIGVGVCCKAIVVSAPVAVAAELWLFGDQGRLRAWARRSAGWAIALAAMAVVLPTLVFCQLGKWDWALIRTNYMGLGGGPLDVNTAGVTHVTYLLTQVVVLVRYLMLAAWPAGLCIDHDIPVIASLYAPSFWGAAAVLCVISVAVWRTRTRMPMVLWGWTLFLCGVLPQSGLVPAPDLMFEHRTYLGCAGLAWMVGAAMSHVCAGRAARRAAVLVLVMVAAALAVATWHRCHVWQTECTLWADALRTAPLKQRVVNNCANAMLEAGRPAEAVAVIRQALPRWSRVLPTVLATLGNCFFEQGQHDQATVAYAAALSWDQWSNPDVRYNLALSYAFRGRADNAVEELSRLLWLHREYPDAQMLLGVLHATAVPNRTRAARHLAAYLRAQPEGEDADAARRLLGLLADGAPLPIEGYGIGPPPRPAQDAAQTAPSLDLIVPTCWYDPVPRRDEDGTLLFATSPSNAVCAYSMPLRLPQHTAYMLELVFVEETVATNAVVMFDFRQDTLWDLPAHKWRFPLAGAVGSVHRKRIMFDTLAMPSTAGLRCTLEGVSSLRIARCMLMPQATISPAGAGGGR